MPRVSDVVVAIADVRRLTVMLQKSVADIVLTEQQARWMAMRLLEQGVTLPPEPPAPDVMPGQTTIHDFTNRDDLSGTAV